MKKIITFVFFKNNNFYKCFLYITIVMKFDTTLWKVLHYFFNHPYDEVYLRELAKKSGISVFSAKKSIDELIKEKILIEIKRGKMRYVKVNADNLFFRHLKIAFSIKKIEESGLIEYLVKNVPAIHSILLFGSMARGEDDENSDIDLLVIGQKKKIDLSRFEEMLGKEIRAIIMKWTEWREKARDDKAFYIEVITKGIVLYGEVPVVE